jgi:O-antigen/teichoic acid export membrane protein
LALVAMLVTLNLLLIPRYGLTGAAIGSAASLGILNLLRYLFLYFKFGLQPYNVRFVYILLIGAFAYFPAFALPLHVHYILDLLIRSTIFSILFLLPIYFFRISSDLNLAADNYLRKLRIIH